MNAMKMEKSKFVVMDKILQEKMLNEVKEFLVRDSDIFLLGQPKSGTTWAQEMIWLIVNNLNYEGAKVFVDERIPILEMCGGLSKDAPIPVNPECHWNSIEFIKKMEDPRCIKTHLKWQLLPNEILNQIKKPKIIYIARNPKDVCLSTYCYFKNVLNCIDCTFEEYCDFFLGGYKFADNCQKNYWNNVLYFWEHRSEPNILFIKYEDMKHNLVNVIHNVSTFLEKTLTEEDEQRLVKWLDFETMKNNDAVNHNSLYQKSGFMRTGKVGEHKKVMSTEMIKKFDSWIEENLKDSDYEL